MKNLPKKSRQNMQLNRQQIPLWRPLAWASLLESFSGRSDRRNSRLHCAHLHRSTHRKTITCFSTARLWVLNIQSRYRMCSEVSIQVSWIGKSKILLVNSPQKGSSPWWKQWSSQGCDTRKRYREQPSQFRVPCQISVTEVNWAMFLLWWRIVLKSKSTTPRSAF